MFFIASLNTKKKLLKTPSNYSKKRIKFSIKVFIKCVSILEFCFLFFGIVETSFQHSIKREQNKNKD